MASIDLEFERRLAILLQDFGHIPPGTTIYVEALNSMYEYGVDVRGQPDQARLPIQHIQISVRGILPPPLGGITDIEKIPKRKNHRWTLEEVRQKARELDAPTPPE